MNRRDPSFLIRSALYNARRMAKAEFKRKPNWALAMELFLCGSSVAHEMCRLAQVDPDGGSFEMWKGYPTPAPSAKACPCELWCNTAGCCQPGAGKYSP